MFLVFDLSLIYLVTYLGQGLGYSFVQASMLISGLWYVKNVFVLKNILVPKTKATTRICQIMSIFGRFLLFCVIYVISETYRFLKKWNKKQRCVL